LYNPWNSWYWWEVFNIKNAGNILPLCDHRHLVDYPVTVIGLTILSLSFGWLSCHCHLVDYPVTVIWLTILSLYLVCACILKQSKIRFVLYITFYRSK